MKSNDHTAGLFAIPLNSLGLLTELLFGVSHGEGLFVIPVGPLEPLTALLFGLTQSDGGTPFLLQMILQKT
jgi:hypothetical protein